MLHEKPYGTGEVFFVNPRDILLAIAHAPPDTPLGSLGKIIERAPLVRAHHDRCAHRNLPGRRGPRVIQFGFPRFGNSYASLPLLRQTRLRSADNPGLLVVRGIEPMRM